MDQLMPNRSLQTAPFRRKPDTLPDELAIFDRVARFDDAANRRGRGEFRSFWADDAAWETGTPHPMQTPGADRITETLYPMAGQFDCMIIRSRNPTRSS